MPCTVMIAVALLLAVLLSGVSLLAVMMRNARLVDASKRAAAALGLEWRRGPQGFSLEGEFRGAHVLLTHVEDVVERKGEERAVYLPVLVAETDHDEATLTEALPGAEIVDGRARFIVRRDLESVDDYTELFAAATGRSAHGDETGGTLV